MAKRRTGDSDQLGFGFDPEVSAHHFAVVIAQDDADAPVLIEERFTYGDDADARAPEPRARLNAYTWSRISPEIQAHFNRRLADASRTTSAFRPGENLLAPYLGKELALLFWVLDDVDPTDLPNALGNWLAFVPEERWWLYTTVKASGSGPEESGSGWRKAIRIAFRETPAPPPADSGPGLLDDAQHYVRARSGDPDTSGDSPPDKPASKRKRKRKRDTPLLPLFD